MTTQNSTAPWLVKGSAAHFAFMIFLAWVGWAMGYSVGLYGPKALDWSTALVVCLVGAAYLATGVFTLSIKGYLSFVLVLLATGFAWGALFVAVSKALA